MKYLGDYIVYLIKSNYWSIFFRDYFKLIGQTIKIFNIDKIIKTLFMPLFGQKGIGSIINGVFLKLILLALYLPFVITLLFLETAIYFGVFIGFIYFLLQFNLLGMIGIILSVILLLYYLYDFTQFLKINHTNLTFENIYLSAHTGLRNAVDLGNYNLYNIYQYISKNINVTNYLKLLEIEPQEFHNYVYENVSLLNKQEYEQSLLDTIKKYKIRNLNEVIMFMAFLKVIDLEKFVSTKEQISVDDFEKAYLILIDDSDSSFNFSVSVLNRISQELNQAVTPTLYKYTTNLSRQKDKNIYFKNIARLDIVDNIINLLLKGGSNVLVSGKFGTGKSTLIKGLVYSINKDFFQLNIDKLLEDKESVSVLQRIISEISIVGGVLYIENIHRLVSDNLTGSQDILLNILASNLKSRRFKLIMSTDPANLEKYLRNNPSIIQNVSLIDFFEPEGEDLEKILINHFSKKIIDYTNNVKISYLAMKEAITISDRYNFTDSQPTKTINLISTALTSTTYVSLNEIKTVASQLYRMPINTLSDEERDKYLNLENEFKGYIIGQESAVKVVANALRRARLRLKSENKPIASFLFSGPTGVGKTEMAKTINKIMFNDNKFLRLDMSEYQQKDSLERLIGGNGERGILTNFVEKNPYSLILLDEIEKAHKDILDLFLQVLDDSRLTDATGNTVNFASALIVMTTNIGTREILDNAETLPIDEIEKLALNSLKDYYRLEFLNRFSNIVVFHSLTRSEILQITRLKLIKLKNKLMDQKIDIDFSVEFIQDLADKSFSPTWGARNIDRTIELEVENSLAEKLLRKELGTGDKIVL